MWGCSVERQHPCSEDWAMHVAGRRMSAMLKAASNAELNETFSGAAMNDTFGFETHVHSATSGRVFWDGHDPTFIGEEVGTWLSAVGLDTNDLPTHDSTGRWLKLRHALTRNGPVAERYLFFISVPIPDELADGVEDGVGDTFNVLVAVSGAAPMRTAAPSSEACERIRCVGDIASADPTHCSEVDEYGVCRNPLDWSSWTYDGRLVGAINSSERCVERVNE